MYSMGTRVSPPWERKTRGSDVSPSPAGSPVGTGLGGTGPRAVVSPL